MPRLFILYGIITITYIVTLCCYCNVIFQEFVPLTQYSLELSRKTEYSKYVFLLLEINITWTCRSEDKNRHNSV